MCLAQIEHGRSRLTLIGKRVQTCHIAHYHPHRKRVSSTAARRAGGPTDYLESHGGSDAGLQPLGRILPPYDVHPWAIPMEYRSSMLLFLMFLITVRLRIHYRIGILAALLVYSYSITRWVAVLFLAGAIIAETVVLYPIREHESPDSQECQNGSGREGYQLLSLQEMTNTRGTPLPSSSSGAEASTAVTDSRQRRLYRQVLCTITIIFGLYLMSAPDYCISRTPGYRTVAVLIPPHDERDWRFYPSVGAILLVAALAHSPRDGLLVHGLESRLVQYLGRVSYSLCLVHGPVMHGLGYRVFPLIWAWRWDGW